jgi:hypothetical protein
MSFKMLFRGEKFLKEIYNMLFSEESADPSWLLKLGKLALTESFSIIEAENIANEIYRDNKLYKNAYSRIAYFLLHLGIYSEANRLFIKDSIEGNQNWWGKLRHAECFALQGDIEKAFLTVTDIYTNYPEAVNGFGHLGWTLLRRKYLTTTQAIEIITRDLETGRVTPGFKLVIAHIIAKEYRLSAENLIYEAYESNSSLTDGFTHLAIECIKDKNYTGAVEWFEKDDALNRLTPESRLKYAKLLMDYNNYEKGEKQLNTAYQNFYTQKGAVPDYVANVPNKISLVRKEYFHYAEPRKEILQILKLNEKQWFEIEFYRRVHINQFYEIYSSLEKKPEYILEWGSGFSTIIIAHLGAAFGAKYLLTIDDNKSYQESILASIPRDSFIEICSVSQTGQIWPWEAEEDNYATLPLSKNYKYDFIFIDGRRRNECMLAASKCLADDGLVLLHDSWRKRYDLGKSLFSEFKSLDYYQLMTKRNNH